MYKRQVVGRGIHIIEAPPLYVFPRGEHSLKGTRAALVYAAEGFFRKRREPGGDIARRRVSQPDVGAGLFFYVTVPPCRHLAEAAADLRRPAAREQDVYKRQGYGKYFSNNWQEWKEMPDEFSSVLIHFPPFPYVRESRRIVGVTTMTVKDVERDRVLRRMLKTNPDSIALGEYPTDIHGLREPQYLDRDLGERADEIPADSEWKGGLFQIPDVYKRQPIPAQRAARHLGGS